MITNQSNRGQAIVLIVFAIIGLIAITALAIDGGNAFADRRKAQSAADNAALSGALAGAKEGNVYNAANAIILANHPINDGWEIQNPPGPGCNGTTPTIKLFDDTDSLNYYYQVVLHTSVDTYFGPVIGINKMYNCVQAIARGKPPIPVQALIGNGMVSLNPVDCNSFWAHGTSDTQIVEGGIFVNSTCESDAFLQQGAGVVNVQDGGICTVGGAAYDPGMVSPPPVTCPESIPYPPDWIMPSPECSSDSVIGENIIGPGNIDGRDIGGQITMQSGIYCITGNVSINSGDIITGNGVLLFLIDGSLTINGGATVNLSAAPVPAPPTTPGVYDGLLIFLPMTNSSVVKLNGTEGSSFTGTILAPASTITAEGNNDTDSLYHSQIIGYNINLIGTGDLFLNYQAGMNVTLREPTNLDLVK